MGRKVTENRRQEIEMRERRQKMSDGRQETGDRDRRQEMSDGRQEMSDERQDMREIREGQHVEIPNLLNVRNS